MFTRKTEIPLAVSWNQCNDVFSKKTRNFSEVAYSWVDVKFVSNKLNFKIIAIDNGTVKFIVIPRLF